MLYIYFFRGFGGLESARSYLPKKTNVVNKGTKGLYSSVQFKLDGVGPVDIRPSTD